MPARLMCHVSPGHVRTRPRVLARPRVLLRGQPDVVNDMEDDADARIFLLSDISHLIKKVLNHAWKSDVRRRRPTPLNAPSTWTTQRASATQRAESASSRYLAFLCSFARSCVSKVICALPFFHCTLGQMTGILAETTFPLLEAFAPLFLLAATLFLGLPIELRAPERPS